MRITFDLETVGSDDPAVIAEIAVGISHPKTMSKPETIAKWEAEEKPGLVEEALKKTSFDGGVGRIVCIGWAVDDDAPSCVYSADESEMLKTFYAKLKEAIAIPIHGGQTEHAPVFVGHNISGFDLRFLWQRSVCLGIRPPSSIPFHAKPWDKTLADTMILWHPDREKRISLDRLCKILGVESPKGEMDGSKVWDYVKAGKIAEVAEYCKRDVAAIRECHRRMAFL